MAAWPRRLGSGSAICAVACLVAAAPALAESLSVSSTGEREIGRSQKIVAGGVADGAHRLFVYYEPNRESCQARPSETLAKPGFVPVTPAEGEALPAGPFTKEYTGPVASTDYYGVCAYLATAASQFYDAVAVSCVMPGSECLITAVPPWEVEGAERAAREAPELEAKREREAREHAQARTREETEARELAEARRRLEELEHPRCKVPRLRRHTLAAARRLLRGAHCALGTVRRPHASHGRLLVRAQSSRPGLILAGGARVSVRLAP